MGRPREFDADEALDSAMRVFWEKGYEGTSLKDLMAGTGLQKQSLYGAFGNKHDIYLAALRHYDETRLGLSAELLRQPGTARDRVGRLFQGVIDRACGAEDRTGCMLCNAAVDRAPLDPEARSAVRRCVAGFERAIAGALAETQPYDDDRPARARRARAILAAYFGLNVLAKAGADRATLEDVRDATLDGI